MRLSILFSVVILFSCYLVSAVGVASTYSANDPLNMYPGQEIKVLLTISGEDDVDITLNGEILEGGEIASLEEEVVTVPAGSTVNDRIEVKVPSDASIGQEYTIRYEFRPPAEGEEGDVTGAAISSGVVRAFNVIVVEEPVIDEEPDAETEGRGYMFTIIIIIILGVIVVLYLMFKKKKNTVPVKNPKV